MLYAKQIAPEFQESPLFMGEEMWPENIAICGNRYYREHRPDYFERVQNALDEGELAEAIEGFSGVVESAYFSSFYKNVTEAFLDLLPPEGRSRYSTKEIHALKGLFHDYGRGRSSDDDQIFLEVLSIVTGKKWAYKDLRGNCQGDWNGLYYPVDEWSREGLDALETEYFNTGTEWIIHDEDNTPNGPEDIQGYSIYCYGGTMEEIKEEIAEAGGVAPSEVILYRFKGWIRTEEYEREAV